MPSCALFATRDPSVAVEERILERRGREKQLIEAVERRVHVVREPEVEMGLVRILQKVSHHSKVLLTHGANSQSLPQSFALPNGTVLVAIQALKRLEYENEVAGLFAVVTSYAELGNAWRSSNPGDAFVFTYDDHVKATQQAIQKLYVSGYDPRGVLKVWQDWGAHLKEQNLQEWETRDLQAMCFTEIARLSPLKNPIVRSNDFVEIQKRIKRL